jgi:DNA polymerase-3 subunit delta
VTIFFYGPNTYAIRMQLQQMTAAYLAKSKSDFGLERLDGSNVKWNDLSASLQATPFLASSRLVIVNNLSANKPEGGKVASLMGRVPSTTVAVFVEKEVDQRTSVYKELSKADKVLKFDQLTGSRLQAWVRSEVERLGGTSDGAAIRELIELAGEDQWRLSEEINKIINYEPLLSVETVRMLVTPSVERSIFDLVEAVTLGRISVALNGFHALLRQKESEMYILTMVQWQLRNLLFAKAAPASMSPSELAKAAGMSPYVAGKMVAAQQLMSESVLTAAYKAAADCEFDIKTGRTRSEAAVEQLLYRIAASAQAKS